MATYKGIQGQTVQKLSSDLTSSADTVGQLWYNGTGSPASDGAFKIAAAADGVWSSGGGMVNARLDLGCTGTQTATIAMAGQTSPTWNYTETYNGTAWTEVADLNNDRGYCAAFGTQTAAIVGGGSPQPAAGTVTESWNGSTWTEVNVQPFATYAQMRDRKSVV